MTNYFRKALLFITILFGTACTVLAQNNQSKTKEKGNVVDQIIWVVGNEVILKSDVEQTRLEMLASGMQFDGDPDCLIPEQLAYQKLFLHQADLDSIKIPESTVSKMVEQQINYNIQERYGSSQAMEQLTGKTMKQLRSDWRESTRDHEIVKQVKNSIVGDIKLAPSEVRRFYDSMPKDSLPFIPETVEGQIIMQEPKIPLTETDAVKARLRDFTKRINSGESSFSALALLYSEDLQSAKAGGELGFINRSSLDPEFASAAFALTDPSKISNIVKSEFGYHIIQLIERRGDLINVRHILLRPKISASEIIKTQLRLDSIVTDIRRNKFSFDEAALVLSSDKATRNNKGLMVNQNVDQSGNPSANMGTPRFTMQELPPEIAKVVDTMKVNEISKAFPMKSKNGSDVVIVIKLKIRNPGHRANLVDDYSVLKAIVEERKRNEVIDKWIQEKIKETYVWISPEWRNCDFKYKGWVK